MEKGLRAFVSYIRAYKEHHCSYIFRCLTVPCVQLSPGKKKKREEEEKKALSFSNLSF